MKHNIFDNNYNLLKILQFLLFIIYFGSVILLTISNTNNVLNDFIVSLKPHLLIGIFIIAGFVESEKIKNKYSFSQNVVAFYSGYLLFYFLFLVYDNNYAINKSLIPIELLGIQSVFLNISFGDFFNAVYLATYIFISRSLFPVIIEHINRISDKHKYMFVIFLLFFVTYLYKEDYYNNIFFYIILYVIGIIMQKLANNFNLKKLKRWQKYLTLVVILFFIIIENISSLNIFNYFSIILIIVVILIMSTINIKFYNIINYRYIFMISSCFSLYLLYLKNGYLINFFNKIIIPYNKGILLFIILAIIAVIISFYQIIIIKNRKNVLIHKVFITFIIVYVLCLFIIYFKSSPTLVVSNKNEIINLDNYTICGESNANIIEVYINNNIVTTLSTFNNKFEYKLDSKLLNKGWNYIEFKAYRHLFTSSTSGGVINKLGNKNSVYIPVSYVIKARQMNKAHRDQYFLDDNYDYYKNYIGAGNLTEGEPIYLDNKRIPRLKRNGVLYFQPVFVTAVALDTYKNYLETKNNNSKNDFLNLADWLIENNDNGKFEYPIDWIVGNININAGWSSSMAQGRALSVLSRAYYLTKNNKYLKSGKVILEYMLKPADDDITNGTAKKLYDFTNKYDELKKYNDYHIYETYVTNPSSYSLNGDLFALLGLYDWYRISQNKYGSAIAKKAFDDGIKSVEIILPYYDYYGWSSYDLMQYTNDSIPHVGNKYAHRCHLQLLYILYTKTQSKIIKYYVDQFKSYYDDDFWIQSEIIYKES